MWNTLRRWRTWIFNAVAGAVVLIPEVLSALAGFNWGTVIPPQYMPYLTIAIIAVNILMRPRPAVLPGDPEAEVTRHRGDFR